MPNDAKLGLVAGVAVVILIAVVFFRKDVADGHAADVALPPPPKSAPELPPAPRASPIPPHGDNDLPALPPPPTASDVPMVGGG
jgi:hypothetical protein